MSIQVDGVTKRFGEFAALDGVDLAFDSGELVALLGPSGSARPRCCASSPGSSADAGRVLLDGEDVTERACASASVGFVFQHYALFAHMTVVENIAFGLRVRPRGSARRARDRASRARVCSAASSSTGSATRYPHSSRAASASASHSRARWPSNPRVLLLDEPFGALDARVRQRAAHAGCARLHDELARHHVFVTHDQEEALEVADRVVVMNAGAVEQVGAATRCTTSRRRRSCSSS